MAQRRPKKSLNTVLYCRVEKKNATFAKYIGRKRFGSHSSFVNHLIAEYRGIEPADGVWQPTEEEGRKLEIE